ncbi:tRNA (guanosine(46)-N7)-methyltransferase TrmB [Vagococcus humatus]|uniref:tRNA (guanine-N(7)-)-methyltransferase n=1 Tax=Vagococcus humatus TaxID=1889241 RepID=A0A3R9YLC6_9ENTE|nr:tRNA (guanosine(46)-N7)-methyltransferase TrmB [Vagococcus humatus]RST90338.1 tRNA (guanosine(46)-N7)-methyltransferase TrmB [Vagococcus humatus]
MRVRNKPWAKDRIEENPQYVATNPTEWHGKWQQRFEKNQPLHIEVGTGKGRFITEMAKAHPEINYIGIELQMNVLVMALDKLLEEQLPNLQLILVDGQHLTEIFDKGEVSQVYLNFSDPWPKTRHAKRRLTHENFLKLYEQILKPNGQIHFKTDNRGLFEYSLASFSQYGLILNQVWLDLHQSDFEGNIMTEYEEKFSKKGQPIYRVEACFPNK